MKDDPGIQLTVDAETHLVKDLIEHIESSIGKLGATFAANSTRKAESRLFNGVLTFVLPNLQNPQEIAAQLAMRASRGLAWSVILIDHASGDVGIQVKIMQPEHIWIIRQEEGWWVQHGDTLPIPSPRDWDATLLMVANTAKDRQVIVLVPADKISEARAACPGVWFMGEKA